MSSSCDVHWEYWSNMSSDSTYSSFSFTSLYKSLILQGICFFAWMLLLSSFDGGGCVLFTEY